MLSIAIIVVVWLGVSARSGEFAAPSDAIQKQISGDALYLVLAPVGPSGIAILGDADQFVTMGKKRVTAFIDHGAVRITVAFACDAGRYAAINRHDHFMPASHSVNRLFTSARFFSYQTSSRNTD